METSTVVSHVCISVYSQLVVFDVVCFIPDFSDGGDNRDTLLPAVTLDLVELN